MGPVADSYLVFDQDYMSVVLPLVEDQKKDTVAHIAEVDSFEHVEVQHKLQVGHCLCRNSLRCRCLEVRWKSSEDICVFGEGDCILQWYVDYMYLTSAPRAYGRSSAPQSIALRANREECLLELEVY